MNNNIKLTTLTKTSGCAAKIGPKVLDSVLNNLPISRVYQHKISLDYIPPVHISVAVIISKVVSVIIIVFH